MSGIRISPKHGVNPSMSRCYFCDGEKNELILTGMLPGDAEAPREAVWNTEPCDQCKEYMKQGVIIISIRDGEDERMEREQQEFSATIHRLTRITSEASTTSPIPIARVVGGLSKTRHLNVSFSRPNCWSRSCAPGLYSCQIRFAT